MQSFADETRIITATLDQIEDVIPLFDGYRQFYGQAADQAAARRFLQERFILGESLIFLAYLGSAAVGFTQLYPSFSSVSLERLWILNDLYVVPEARGRRVGQALIERAAGYSSRMGAKGLVLETAVDNLSAQKLYERLGFVRDTAFYRYALKTPPHAEQT